MNTHKWLIKFNPRRGDYRAFKGWVLAVLALWAAWMFWALVADLLGFAEGEVGSYDLALSFGWVFTSWLCAWHWLQRVM